MGGTYLHGVGYVAFKLYNNQARYFKIDLVKAFY